MTEHHPNCEDATGAYPGSCTCKTIAMDNLIAQDADLIDSPLVDRLRWVSEWYFVDPVDGTAYASDDPLDAADRIEALEAALREVFEEWAGSEGFIPETAPEGYMLQLTKRMADIARAALAGDSHDQ